MYWWLVREIWKLIITAAAGSHEASKVSSSPYRLCWTRSEALFSKRRTCCLMACENNLGSLWSSRSTADKIFSWMSTSYESRWASSWLASAYRVLMRSGVTCSICYSTSLTIVGWSRLFLFFLLQPTSFTALSLSCYEDSRFSIFFPFLLPVSIIVFTSLGFKRTRGSSVNRRSVLTSL